ncbi:P-type DNA transfer ATPase VirB11 [Sphingomonas crocodyli]|uniref:Type IV secretion system protein n=1 Tax=Sphingomonas crocodyli TaxID=1979270 RepID=A0A437LY11_9SPHN|nr:P-type DNA transfer ATPase VirB11 [Sphingomonas crocodyli]RVT90295.1 P-type DNA transfer ATPase VirB11 [Sphingomonas crocodyli]
MRASDTSLLRHHLAPLQPLLAREGVSELVINRPFEIGIEMATGWDWIKSAELDSDWLMTLARSAAAVTRQDIADTSPICSTILPGGERVQIVVPPVVPAETVSLTIRKPSTVDKSLEDYAASGLFEATRIACEALPALDEELLSLRDKGLWLDFFALAVEGRKNILVSGATGSGKTSFSKSLIQHIPAHERILTIEDTRELTVPHRNVVHMTYAKDGQGLAKVGAKALLESALRMRPDRILLQELRDGTAFFYLRNVNSGHPGSITTVHANSAAAAFEQLTLLVKESEGGRDLARDDIRGMLHTLVDIVVQLRRFEPRDGEPARYRMTEVYYDPVRSSRAQG